MHALKCLWGWFWRPARRFTWGAIFSLGILTGVVGLVSLNTLEEYTGTLEFCVSCHEMRNNTYKEYQKTVHFKNRGGVRTICPDCHVPKEWGAMLVRKIGAVRDIYHSLLGTISTPEKFEAKRRVLAERVWKLMEESDSRECRNCHSFDAMDPHKQSRRAVEKMKQAALDKKTCIECHKGIAHKLPEGYGADDDD